MASSQISVEEFWKVFPWQSFVPSLKVDFALFFCGYKKVIRSRCLEGALPTESCLRKVGLKMLVDAKRYVFFATSDSYIKEAVVLDLSTTPHEYAFGKLLGYPECCVRKMETIGESNIDEYAETFCKQDFTSPHLNIKYYSSGIALISHIPCSLECNSSHKMADACRSFVKRLQDQGVQDPWVGQISFFASGAVREANPC